MAREILIALRVTAVTLVLHGLRLPLGHHRAGAR